MPFYQSPSGQISELEGNNAALAAQSGWRLADPAKIQLYANQKLEEAGKVAEAEKFNAPDQIAKTALEGGLRGLTFSGSDFVENQLFNNGQELAQRQEAHPVLSFGSEALGMALPSLIPGVGEAGAAAELPKATRIIKGIVDADRAKTIVQPLVTAVPRAAEAVKEVGAGAKLAEMLGYTPAGLSLRAERSVANAVEKALPETTGLLGRVMERGIAEGAGQAVTGAELGIGHILHENAIGDPNYTAEALLANPGRITDAVGSDALFMGSLGTLIGGGSALLGAGVKKITDKIFTEQATNWLAGLEAKNAGKAAGMSTGEWSSLVEKHGKDEALEMLREGKKLGLVETLNSPSKIEEKILSVKQEAADSIEKALQSASEEKLPITGEKGLVDSVLEVANKYDENLHTKSIADKIKAHVQNWLGETLIKGEEATHIPGRFEEGATVQDLYKLSKEFENAAQRKSPLEALTYEKHQAWNEVKDLLNEEIKKRLGDPSAVKKFDDGLKKASIANLFESFSKHLETGQGAASILGGEAGAVASLAAGHGLLHAGLSGGLSAAAVSLLKNQKYGIASTVAGGLKSVLEGKATSLGALASNNATLSKKIEEQVRRIAEAPAKTALVTEQSNKDRVEWYKKTSQQIRTVKNYAVLEDRLTKLTENWAHHAPNTSAAVGMVASNAIAFLNSKLPQPPPPTTEELLSGKSKWVPSSNQIESFNKYYEAVLNPANALKMAQAGRLAKEHIEALQTVYPKLFATMQEAAASTVAKSKGKLSRQAQNSLSLILGKPLDTTGVNMVQKMLSTVPSKAQPAQISSVKIKAASRLSLGSMDHEE